MVIEYIMKMPQRVCVSSKTLDLVSQPKKLKKDTHSMLNFWCITKKKTSSFVPSMYDKHQLESVNLFISFPYSIDVSDL